MAPAALEPQDRARDAAFNKAMHGKSSQATGGFAAILSKKDHAAAKASSDEYFKHFDNKAAKDETPEIREASQPITPFPQKQN